MKFVDEARIKVDAGDGGNGVVGFRTEKYIPRVDVTPEMGKFAVFNGRHYHASTCPKMLPSRIVLTMNFTAEKI